MNWLDIILIIVMVIVFIVGMIFLIWGVKEDETGTGVIGMLIALGIIGFMLINFIVIDKKSGSTVGEITSVDKNFFGTTAVYIKANNNSEEKYCVENKDVANKANELIGKKVKITYGTRIGLYSTGRCNQAPIDTIELINEG